MSMSTESTENHVWANAAYRHLATEDAFHVWRESFHRTTMDWNGEAVRLFLEPADEDVLRAEFDRWWTA